MRRREPGEAPKYERISNGYVNRNGGTGVCFCHLARWEAVEEFGILRECALFGIAAEGFPDAKPAVVLVHVADVVLAEVATDKT